MRRRYLYIAVAILAFAMLPSAHAQTWYLGEIRFVAFNFAPEGWLFATGRSSPLTKTKRSSSC